MDAKEDDAKNHIVELGEFLRSCRGRLTPADAGMPRISRRRVPGLRREELAQLAGLSVDCYTRLEQGRRPSPCPATPTDQILFICTTEPGSTSEVALRLLATWAIEPLADDARTTVHSEPGPTA